jgi:hypothetical protein
MAELVTGGRDEIGRANEDAQAVWGLSSLTYATKSLDQATIRFRLMLFSLTAKGRCAWGRGHWAWSWFGLSLSSA